MLFQRLGGNITDDTGKRVKLLDSAGASEWPAKGDDRITHLLLRVRKTMSASTLLESLVTIVVAIALLAVYGISERWVSRHFSVGGVAYFLMLVVAAVLAQRLLWRTRLHTSRRAVARLVLEEGLCPTCGYNFYGTGAERAAPSAMVACPECGGSWRRDRMERIVAFASLTHLRPAWGLVTKREKVSKWSAEDARGGRVDLVPPGLHRLRAHPSSPEHGEALASARREITRSGRWVRILLAGCIAVVYVLMLYAAERWDPAGYVFLTVIAAALFFPTLYANFAYSPRWVVRAMLERRLCPSCGLDLRGQARSERDGAIVCPSCRAAWDMPGDD
jgi:Zn-finger nucleic acid-binding protein